ncbi:hypothetical protein HRR83_001494 [Exophiala dermatitidis]|uniref:Uncharacterized protein n=1 Tax=Exophiala dermatitidis TaxID=5970 RepID=A0AAN6IXY0_EXODE|nr:hypothetical protein HRR74_001498 [Exophiala dermatitidis]KAJ4526754.1 hypothetical protein HRR73_001549 [Exophiala dermatitidis]KAJ4532460.1 hypothetical protein HRR76_007452 [Exophiala dermatitidis]KAJ4576866.1 hypothetical protein HRR81_003318 [Exophiala dermatitidis]KAJ4584144.1 hypothetical protein HRR82_003472 [Exophiala dermatitidis]
MLGIVDRILLQKNRSSLAAITNVVQIIQLHSIEIQFNFLLLPVVCSTLLWASGQKALNKVLKRFDPLFAKTLKTDRGIGHQNHTVDNGVYGAVDVPGQRECVCASIRHALMPFMPFMYLFASA